MASGLTRTASSCAGACPVCHRSACPAGCRTAKGEGEERADRNRRRLSEEGRGKRGWNEHGRLAYLVQVGEQVVCS
eukprot:753722-Hanusia_phi.AAC.2